MARGRPRCTRFAMSTSRWRPVLSSPRWGRVDRERARCSPSPGAWKTRRVERSWTVEGRCRRGQATTGPGVVVTHDAQLASWADRVVFLRDGRVVDQTAPAAGPESLLLPNARP